MTKQQQQQQQQRTTTTTTTTTTAPRTTTITATTITTTTAATETAPRRLQVVSRHPLFRKQPRTKTSNRNSPAKASSRIASPPLPEEGVTRYDLKPSRGCFGCLFSSGAVSGRGGDAIRLEAFAGLF